jgi:hypothetical protein
MLNENNLAVVAIAAYPNWYDKTEVIRRSADKNDIRLDLLQKGEQWVSYYENKQRKFRENIKLLPKEKTHILFVDARDVVFIKPAEQLYTALSQLPDDKITMNRCRDMPFPYRTKWLQSRINLKFPWMANSGVYFGSRDIIMRYLDDTISLHDYFVSDETRDGTIEQLLKQGIAGDQRYMVTDPLITNRYKFVDDDQFYYQILQAQWQDYLQCDFGWHIFAMPEIYPDFINGKLPPKITETSCLIHGCLVDYRQVGNKKSDGGEWKDWAERQGLI